jgi:hypothetical protein
MSENAANLVGIRGRSSSKVEILRPEPPSDEHDINEAKLTRQIRAFKEVGLGAILAMISILIAAIALTITFMEKANQRGLIDGTVQQALRNTENNRADDKKIVEDDKKTLLDAIQGLRGDITQALDIAKQTRADVGTMRQSSDQQMMELRQKSDALWNWSGKMDSRIAALELKVDARR